MITVNGKQYSEDTLQLMAEEYVKNHPQEKTFEPIHIGSGCVSIASDNPKVPFPIEIKIFGKSDIFSTGTARRWIAALQDVIAFVENNQ